MSSTVDRGVSMSDSSESSNEKWIYSGLTDALVSGYLEANANCEKQMQPGLISVATGQTDFMAI